MGKKSDRITRLEEEQARLREQINGLTLHHSLSKTEMELRISKLEEDNRKNRKT
jgi:hypothetical protein